MLHSICQQIWKLQQWPQDCKMSVFIPTPKKGNTKECSNYHTVVLISHAGKIMPKIVQVGLQQCLNHKHPDVQAVFRKRRGTRDQIANIHWVIEKDTFLKLVFNQPHLLSIVWYKAWFCWPLEIYTASPLFGKAFGLAQGNNIKTLAVTALVHCEFLKNPN